MDTETKAALAEYRAFHDRDDATLTDSVWKAIWRVLDLALAEHPADDDALATAGSLEAEGFEFRFNRWQYHVACLTVTVRLSGPDVGLWIETPSLMTKLVDAIPTNRHVRRLISALEGK